MYQKLLKRTTIYCIVFFIIAMSGMFYYDANKIIVIADSSAVNTGNAGEENRFSTQYQLLMKSDASRKSQFEIPLESTIMAEDVQIQNHYVEKELWIGLKGATTDFYSREYVTGNLENVSFGGYDIVDGFLWIKFAMKDVFEFESTMNNGKLTIKMDKPKYVY